MKRSKWSIFFVVAGMVFALLSTNMAAASSLEGLIKKTIRDAGREIERAITDPAASDEYRMNRTQRIRAQRGLNALGYNVGRPDGSFGAKTRRGIRRYQADNGFASTGYLTRQQYRSLASAGEEPDDPQQQLSRDEIVRLQEALNELGFNVGRADGKIGRGTARGIAAFLRSRDLDPDVVKLREAYDLALKLTGEDDGGSTVAEVEETEPEDVSSTTEEQASETRASAAVDIPQPEAKDLMAKYDGQILSKGLGRGNFYYPMFALQRQRFLDNNTNLEIYRTVLLNIAIRIMNADIEIYNELNKAKIEIDEDEARLPRRQRTKHLHHMIYMEDLLDHPKADDLAQLVLQLNWDTRFLAEFAPIEHGEKTANHIYFSFFDPTRVGDGDVKFYLARNIEKVEKLIRLLVRNLPDKTYFNGQLEYISVDPFEAKLKLQRPDSFLEIWDYRNGGSGNEMPQWTADRQIYDDNFRDSPYQFEVENDEIYTWPAGARVVTSNFDDHGERSKARIGRSILGAMRELNSLLAGGELYLDDFQVFERDIDVRKADIPIDMLETISKHFGSSGSSNSLAYLAQVELRGMESVDGNESIAMDLALERLVLYDHNKGNIVAELTPEMFPYYGDAKPKAREQSSPPPEENAAFSFRPAPGDIVRQDESAEDEKAEAKPAQDAAEQKEDQSSAADVAAERVRGPIDGYFYFADDRRGIDHAFQLSGPPTCVPPDWKSTAYLKDNKIGVRYLTYDTMSEGREMLKVDYCMVLAVKESETETVEELKKDYLVLARRPAPVPDEEITAKTDELRRNCNGNSIYNSAYDCSCVAEAYDASLRSLTLSDNSVSHYINNYMLGGRVGCTNETQIVNRAEQFCHRTSSAEDVADVDSFCFCMAKRVFSEFDKRPAYRRLSDISVDVMTSDKHERACLQ